MGALPVPLPEHGLGLGNRVRMSGTILWGECQKPEKLKRRAIFKGGLRRDGSRRTGLARQVVLLVAICAHESTLGALGAVLEATQHWARLVATTAMHSL